MIAQIDALWILAGGAFMLASAFSIRNYVATRRASNLWLWLSISMLSIGLSRMANIMLDANPIWSEVVNGLLLTGMVMLVVALFDFDKELDICANCGNQTDFQEKKSAARRAIRGF